MRVVIHGGMYKTGTTSLQHSLHAYRSELAARGIEYPDTTIRQHSVLLNARNPVWDGDALKKIAGVAAEKGASVLFLSGESVSSLSREQLERLTGCFSGYPVDYVFCFRHWSTYLPSRWAGNCIRRDSQSFGEYLRRALAQETSHPDARYDLLIGNAASSGARQVKAVSWDLAMKDHGSVPGEILRAAGISEQIISMVTRNNWWLNQMKDPMVTEICRVLNGVVADRLGLEQDELFLSHTRHVECNVFFHLIRMVADFPASFLDSLKSLFDAAGRKETVLPAFSELEAHLTGLHAGIFTNIHGRKLFGDRMNRNISFSAYPLAWQDCKEFVDRHDPEILAASIHRIINKT